MRQEECVPAGLLNAMHFKTSITQAAMCHLACCRPKIRKKKKGSYRYQADLSRQKTQKRPFRGLGLQALGWLQS